MADREVYNDVRKRIVVTTEATDSTPQVERVDWHNPTDQQLANAAAVLRQWAADADAVTVTAGNAVATLQVVVNRLGIFFDRFADLLDRGSVPTSH